LKQVNFTTGALCSGGPGKIAPLNPALLIWHLYLQQNCCLRGFNYPSFRFS